ncbi:MAG: CHAT domain-containing protein [Caldimonas sp.]
MTAATHVSDLRVAGLELAVGAAEIAAIWTTPAGERRRVAVGPTLELVPKIDALRAELRDPMRIATGQTPRLAEFCAGWGRAFLPAAELAPAPDVLVLVPHGPAHDLPLHLVEVAGGGGEPARPLGAVAGVAYASSRSRAIRSVGRNPARRRNPAAWRCDGAAANPADEPAPVRSVYSGGVDVLGDLSPTFLATCEQVAGHFSGERRLFTNPSWPYSRAALKAATRKDMPSALCVMAHGFVDAANHRLSGLLVARDTLGSTRRAIPLHGGRYFDFGDLPLRRVPRNIGAGDAAEVFAAAELEIDAAIDSELVMLLGCSAGWGRVLQGDEPASLAETWLKIGSASVLAPMWDAPIAAVQQWTEAFLEGWIDLDLPKALAMRRAMRRMLEGPFGSAPERLGVMALRGDWL